MTERSQNDINISLFWKFTLALVLVVFVFGTVNLLLIRAKVRVGLEMASAQLGITISDMLANESVEPMLYDDLVGLNNRIRSAMSRDSTIAFVYVRNGTDDIVIHTFESGFPRDLLSSDPVRSDSVVSIRLFSASEQMGGIIREFRAPILNGRLGSMHVGMFEGAIQNEVRSITEVFLAMVVIFLILGILGAVGFSHVITTPIKAISNVANKLNLQDLQDGKHARVGIGGGSRGVSKYRIVDEVNILADTFNSMLERLETAHQDLDLAQKVLVRSEKMATVGTFASGVAHEINNPLAGLQNCVKRISRDPDNLAQNRKYLVMMTEALHRIESVVQELLDYTRMDEKLYHSLNCKTIIEKSVRLVSFNLEESGVDLDLDPSCETTWLTGNEGQLQQVLINLFINAIHSIQERVVSDPESERRIRVWCSTSNDMAEIAISDTGNGMTPEIIARIFDPFYSTKSAGKGTGLGLAISQKIADAHGGSIRVASQPNTGTTMKLYIPVATREIPEYS